MIDIRKLKELVKLMVNNDLAEIDLRDPDEQVTLRRHGEKIHPHLSKLEILSQMTLLCASSKR
jgi:hypothetical protein